MRDNSTYLAADERARMRTYDYTVRFGDTGDFTFTVEELLDHADFMDAEVARLTRERDEARRNVVGQQRAARQRLDQLRTVEEANRRLKRANAKHSRRAAADAAIVEAAEAYADHVTQDDLHPSYKAGHRARIVRAVDAKRVFGIHERRDQP